MARLQDQVVVITGASKGIGRAIAVALVQEGCHVVINARSAPDLQTLTTTLKQSNPKAQVVAVAADASTEDGIEQLRDATLTRFGRMDVLVNNVGVGKYGPISELSTADYDWMMNTNMRSTWLCTKAFFPLMTAQQSGHVIFISSVSGLIGMPEKTLYCATKWAQIGFAQALDYEARPHNVKVSVIAPGGVHTQFGFDSGARNPDDPKLQEYLDPETVAEGVVYALTQPAKSRVFLIYLRSMSEALYPNDMT